MKEFIFRAYCTFGKGNSGETEVYVELTDEDAIKNMEKLLDMLEDNDDVQEVYHNVNLPDEE